MCSTVAFEVEGEDEEGVASYASWKLLFACFGGVSPLAWRFWRGGIWWWNGFRGDQHYLGDRGKTITVDVNTAFFFPALSRRDWGGRSGRGLG